jgi:hypothetical protein
MYNEKRSDERGGKRSNKKGRTDFVYDSIELGLVARGKEDIETRFGELDRKLASDAVRRASDDFCVVKLTSRGKSGQKIVP